MSRSDALRSLYKGRSKPNKRDRYPYNRDGNLEERDSSGAVVRTHAFPTYRPLQPDERKEMEEARKLSIAEATDMYQQARVKLHQEYQNPERTMQSVLECNRALERADEKLKSTRFPLYYVAKEDDVVIRTMDFNQPNEIRKYPYAVTMTYHFPYKLQEFYVRVADAGVAPHISVAEVKESSPTPIIFSEQNVDQHPYGFLALNFKTLIQLKNDAKQIVSYPTARHALLAHMAMEFKDDENRQRIVQTENPALLTYSVTDTPGGSANQEEWDKRLKKWIGKVVLAKFTQHPEWAARLKETAPAMLGADEKEDDKIGIGFGSDHPDASRPSKWKKNWLGRALMLVRESLLQKEEEVPLEESTEKEPPKIKKKLKMGTLPSAAAPMAAPIAIQSEASEPILEVPSMAVASELPAALPSLAQQVPIASSEPAIEQQAQQASAAPSEPAPKARRIPRMGVLPK